MEITGGALACLAVLRAALFYNMKTASVQQLPEQWPQILRWIAAGEEVEVTQQDKVVAKVVPVGNAPHAGSSSMGRKQLVESVCGKYSTHIRSSDAFMSDKIVEKQLEERRWGS